MNQIAKSIIVGCTVFMFAVGPRAFGQVTYTNTTEQMVDGFGAAYAYWGADVENAPAAEQAQILGDLYSLKTGAGLSTIRLRVDPDIEPSQGDYDWSPLAGDGWYAQQAEALGVSKVWTTCWSPPAWMKSNDSQLDNGYVPASDYQAFADYLAAYCNQMKSLYGISIYRISPANEPDQSNGGNVGNSWSDLQFQQFVPYLYAENLGAGIMIPEESAWDDSESSGTLQNEPGDLATVAAHAYSVNENGSNYTPLQFATEYNKPVWETEVSDLGNDDESMTNGLAWAEHVQNAFVLGHVNAWHYWWGYDEKTSSGEGLLYYNTSTQSIISIPRRLYTIGNFARFVRPGFHLMGLSANTTSAGIYVSAFANAVTGEVVVVAINPNAAATNLSVSGLPLSFATPYVTSASQNLVQLPNVAVSGGTLSVSLAASSVTTFDGFYGPGPAAGTYTLTNANSNLNLDINSASTSAGASAIQATSNGDTDQVWNLSVNADGTYQITNVNSGLALDVVSASPDVNAQVVQNPANGNDSQKWLIEQSPTGTYSLFNLNSRMKLDVLNSSTSAGAAAVQTAELCLTSQVWKITATGGGGGGTAPSAPTGLTAAAGNASVTLNWNASAGATGYSVYRGTSSGGESAMPIATGVTATSYTDNSVTNGTTYYYEVTATNSYGTSGYSNEAGATPNANSNLVQDFGFETSGTSIAPWVVDGSPSSDGIDTSAPYSGSYDGYIYDDSGASKFVFFAQTISVTANTNYTLTGWIDAYETTNGLFGVSASTTNITNGTDIATTAINNTASGPHTVQADYRQYTVTFNSGSNTSVVVFAGYQTPTNTNGSYINLDNVSLAATAGSAPSAPTGLTATAGNASVALSWSASSGATGYSVYRGTSSGGESATPIATGVTSTSYTDSSVTNGTTYYYEVTATNSSGASGDSNEASATPSSGGGSLPSPWANADVGSPGAAGSASYAGGTFTLNGSGADIWTTTDAFQYVYQQASGGTYSITAKVLSQTNTNQYAKAGVMIRSDLTAGSSYAMVDVTPSEGVEWSYRTTEGGSAAATGGSGAAPYWVRVTGSGGTFTAYESPDGNTWTPIGSPQTITMGGTVYIGLITCSHDAGVLTTATINNVTVNGGGGSAPSAPTGLTAAAGNGSVALSWSASAGATSYSVYRGTSSGGESATPIATGLTSTSYIDTGLSNGTIYYYEVTAISSYGASSDSNEASATPGSTVTVIYDDFSQPNYDTGNHTPYDVYLVDMWDGAPGGGGLPPNDGTTPNHTVLGADLPGGVWQFGGGADTDYDCIEVGNLAGYGASNIELTGGTTTVPYASVHNNENVALSLNGYNANTQLTVSVDVCPQSNACYVGFDSALNAANNFTGLKVDTSGGVSLIVNGSQVGSTIAFTGTWSQNTASQLTFTVNTSTGAISGISLQGSTSNYSFTTTAFTASATPYLAFFTPGGGYALYAYLTVTASPLAAPPAAPAGLTATAGNASVALSWSASAGATSYSVYRGTSSGGESATPIATGLTSTSYIDTGLSNGTIYYYEVTAISSYGASSDSNEASATPGSTVTVIYDDFSQPNYDTGNHTPYDVYLVDMWDGAPGGGGLPPNDGTTPNHTVLGADLPGGVWQFGGGADTDYDCIEVGNLAGYGASNIELTGGTTTVPYASVHNNENVALSLNGYNANTQLTVSVDVCPQSNACYVGFDSALNTANNFTGLKVDTSGGVSLIVNGSQVGSTIAFTGTWSQNTASQLTFTVNTSTGAISGISLQGSTSNYSFTTTAFTASATPYLAFFTPGGGYALYAYLTVTASPP